MSSCCPGTANDPVVLGVDGTLGVIGVLGMESVGATVGVMMIQVISQHYQVQHSLLTNTLIN